MAEPETPDATLTIAQKSWIFLSIFALIVLALLFFQATVNTFIIILVGALITCYFRGLGDFIRHKTGLSSAVGMTISLLGTLVIVAGGAVLVGATIAAETEQLSESFPKLLEKGQHFLEVTPFGKQLVTWYDDFEVQEKLMAWGSGFFKTTFGGVGDMYIIVLIAAYFTASPTMYTGGLLRLIPPAHRPKAADVLFALYNNLFRWLIGRFISMTIVFVLTAIALAVLGVPLWLTLALITGVLVFIPNFGPIIAAFPTFLVALSVSDTIGLITLSVFFIIQFVEGSLITPKVQNRLVKLPPALIILGQVFAGSLVGVGGVIFATPIVLIFKILVEKCYVEPMEARTPLQIEPS